MGARILTAILAFLCFAAVPTEAAANPAQLVQTAFGALATAVSFIPGIGPILSALISLGGGLITQALFGKNQNTGGQREARTRRFDPHPPFRFSFGEFPQEGSVIFHYATGQRYYIAYLLSSIPSADDCIQRIEINDGVVLDIPGFFGVENANYNGVLVPQDIYDMDLGAGAQDPAPFGLDDTPDLKFWCGRGEHTQAPQQWLDEIGSIVLSTDVWKGSTVLFARYVNNPKYAAQQFPLGRPPPLKVFGKFAKLYDPRLDSTSGVPGASGAHRIDDRTTWEYSTNPALAALMLVTHEYALGFDQAMVPIAQWATAADALDSAVSVGAAAADTVIYQPDHENAADQSTSLTDLATGGAGNPHAFTFVGDAKNVTSDADFSTASAIELDGTGDRISRSYHADFRPSSADPLDTAEFCFELEGKFLSAGDGDLYTRYDANTNRRFWLLRRNSGALNFIGSTNGTSPNNLCDLSGGIIADNTKFHAAICRENDVSATPGQEDIIRLFLNGVLVDSVQIDSGDGFFADANVGPMFGDRESGGGAAHARLANIRIVIGAPVYTANFTPPTGPHGTVSDAFRCDGIVEIEDRELSLLDPVLACFAGTLDTTDGLLGVRAGVWVAPTDSLSQPVGEEIEVRGARDAGFDTVRAKFIWSGRDWEETDGPGWQLRSGSRVHPLHLPLVSRHEQAARLEKIAALRAEPNRIVTGVWDGREASRRLGERVNFSLPGFARATSTYVIDSKRLATSVAEDGFEVSTALTLIEDVAATYDWTGADYTAPAEFSAPAVSPPSINAPQTVVIAQSNYQLPEGAVGVRLKITVTITDATSRAAQEIDVQVDDSATFETPANLTITVEPGVTQYVTYLTPVGEGVTYQARARTTAIGTLGISDWVLSNIVTITTAALDYSATDYSAEYA